MIPQCILIFIFSIIDCIVTVLLINKFGMSVELNPILKYFLLETNSVWSLVIFKLLTLIALVGIVRYIHISKIVVKPYLNVLVWTLTIVQICVTLHGLRILLNIF